jgi:Dolichyl-phosphate-mannose-protein mannosyltransferase
MQYTAKIGLMIRRENIDMARLQFPANLFFRKNMHIFLLIIILAISISLNIYGNDFPLGYHPDEVTKVYFIQNNTQDFKHPILILQLTKLANSLFKFESAQQIAILGRITTAFLGTSVVFLIYKISRDRLPKKYALGTALLTAVSPGLVIHSHYLKEDVAFTCGVLLSFLCFFSFAKHIMAIASTDSLQKPKIGNEEACSKPEFPWLQILLLGLSTGIAVTSKYTSVIVVFLYLTTPIYVLRLRNLAYFKGLFLSLIISLVIFLLVNFPLLLNFDTFRSGFEFELRHTMDGHAGILIHPLPQLFTFHLRYSILPSFTIVPLTLALCAIGFCLVQWKSIDWRDRFLVAYVLVFYSIIEISPLKPFPGFIRYGVSLIPVLSYLCMKSIRLGMDFVPRRAGFSFFLILTTLVIVFPALDSGKLDYYLNRDTRGKMDTVLATRQESIFFDPYVKLFGQQSGGVMSHLARLTDLDLENKDQGICTVVSSSFMYDRYLFAGKLENQDTDVYTKYQKYLQIFKYPYTEIAPTYKSFAFSNPTLRVVNVCQDKK